MADRTHLTLSNTAAAERYIYPGEPPRTRFRNPERDRNQHGTTLREQFQAISDDSPETPETPITPSGPQGRAIEFLSDPGFKLKVQSLERRQSGIKLLNTREVDDVTHATVFVPEGKLPLFDRAFERYINEESAQSGNPKNQPLVESITEVRRALLPSFWQESELPFPGETEVIWWEVWLTTETGSHNEQLFRDQAALQSVPVVEGSISFPDRTVVLAEASPEQWVNFPGLFTVLAELRRAKRVPTEFLDLQPWEQASLIEGALQKITFAGQNAPSVCLLDTGVNRGHPLIAPALSEEHLLSCHPDWLPADHHGHGTELAGVSLLGNLTHVVTGEHPIVLRHRLESVKILPPSGANRPEQYGAITTEAIGRAEEARPNTSRAFCLAVTADGRDAGTPSSWSASLDQTIAGVRDDQQRLVLVSAGNTNPAFRDDYPARNHVEGVQDPAHAWNAVTVGAYTNLSVIRSDEYSEWQPVAEAGQLSPSSTTSLVWENRTWPIKPEIVMEGGNFAIEPSSGEAMFIEDLALLTTHHSPAGALFTITGETSGATALASRLAAMIQAQYPSYWPETIRALLIHSAEWTDAMKRDFPAETKKALENRLRCYGYGVPQMEQAMWSAENHATLVAQEELRPFAKINGEVKYNDMHIHALPWPTDVLRDLGETQVSMRVTLSYFIEPSPGNRWSSQKHRYRSYGLRFDVKRPTENHAGFTQRLSRTFWEDVEERPDSVSEEREWELGTHLRTKGSVHSDTWSGTAAELADCGHIGIYPVGGWWKERKHLDRWNRTVRYGLVVTISTEKEDVDLYTPIANQIAIENPGA